MNPRRPPSTASQDNPLPRSLQREMIGEAISPLVRPSHREGVVYERHPLLTREEEVELAQTIERARQRMLEAIAAAPEALDELEMMAQELAEGGMDATDLAPNASSDGREDATIAQNLLEAIQRVRATRSQSRAKRAQARDLFIETVLAHGLSHAAVERLEARLVGARESARTETEAAAIEQDLATFREGYSASERAKKRFVEANFGLVMMLASRKRQGGLPLHDLAQDGCIGLMRAVDKFDHRRGVRFSTYAAWWIRHAINRALSDRSRTIRLPVHLLETRSKAIRTRREFELQHGREPTDVELARFLNVPKEKLWTIDRMPGEPVSMETPLGAEGDTRLQDFIADTERTSPVDELSAKHVHGRLRDLLTLLPDREAQVLRLRFGMDDQDPLTLKEIGERFSLSRERIRQIEASALLQLRALASTEELDAHLAG